MIALVVATATAGCADGFPSTSRDNTRIDISVGRCGQGWSHPHAGQQHFVLHDTDTRAAEVYLTDARTGAVYADVEPLGPGTTASLDIDLGSGRYAFRCAMEDESTVVGPAVTVPGHVSGSAVATLPVTQADLITATQQYETYVRGQLPLLNRLTDTLSSDISEGRLAEARRDWLPAHLEYERLGAAYDAFGDLDAEINGLPDGLPGGVNSRSWNGFHRLEYGLWHGESAAGLVAPAQALRRAVGALAGQFATAQIDPLEISIRAHEITENALQFELTGRTDYGSHSSLATVRANLAGTEVVLGIVRPLLLPRYPQLPATQSALTRAVHDLTGLRHDGTWPALDDLGTAPRERLDAEISQLCELLAPVAAILEPRRAS
jgi:iron uptake system component EfeO